MFEWLIYAHGSKFKDLEKDIYLKVTVLISPSSSQQVSTPETWLFQLLVSPFSSVLSYIVVCVCVCVFISCTYK